MDGSGVVNTATALSRRTPYILALKYDTGH